MLSYRASAPGSLMLLGEYAVLHDFPALVCAVDKRITVTLVPRKDEVIDIISALGSYKTTLKTLDVISPFTFVLATLKQFQRRLPSGCTISIETEFSHQIGFASSAAVTVAMLAALTAWLKLYYSPLERILLARTIVQSVQGMGSGADVAACTLGGVVAYRMHPLSAERIHRGLPLTVVYSGSKTPTIQAVQKVTQSFAKHTHLFKKLLQAIGECAAEGVAALGREDYRGLGNVMRVQQGLMHALGVNTPILHHITESLNTVATVWGAKISGSGLGDCVVALGEISDDFTTQHEIISVEMTDVGVRCEEN